MAQKYRNFYVEWWNIRTSTLIGLGIFLFIAAAIGGTLWYGVNNNWFNSANTVEMPENAAKIISYEGDVRITRMATRETVLVTRETYVSAGDTIQTLHDGRAIVQMIDGSVYSVRPNSTIVVRDNTSIFGGGSAVRVSLDDGQLNVKTDEQPENTENVVEMNESETYLKSQTEASFNTNDSQGEIRIIRGTAETNASGQTSVINENEYAAVNNGHVKNKEAILPAAVPVSPGNQSQIPDSGRGVSVIFNWQHPMAGSITSYYLQVAKSPYFASDAILVDRSSLKANSFRLNGLTPGTYYWRLKSTSGSGQTSEWSDPWKFNVVKRTGRTSISVVEWKVERIGGNVFLVSGKTQAGLQVRTQGRDIFAANDGTFRLQVSTPLSEIAVEVSDDSGNRSGYVLSLRSGKVIKRF